MQHTYTYMHALEYAEKIQPESMLLWLYSLVFVHVTSVKAHVSIMKKRLYSQSDVVSRSVY
jgi:hypothetical protein